MKSYIFNATGANPCEICESLQGDVFSLDDAEVGINFPPIHPNCNCSIIVSVEEAKTDNLDSDIEKYIVENGIRILSVPNRENQVDFFNSI